LHAIWEDRLNNLRKDFDENGVIPRVHGNTGKEKINSSHIISDEETTLTGYVILWL
jgi:hypothetical protein